MPSTAVFDASFAMTLLVPHPLREAAHGIHNQLRAADVTIIAPSLWLYEITSTLQKLAHFKQISAGQVEIALSLAEQFGITLIAPDFSLARRAITWSQRLKRASAYDSFYLALAEERGCDLWTADVKLSNAVQQSWVRLLA